MNDFGKESLSALLDGEVDDLELRRLLKESESNPELLETWNRYHLAHSLLHGEAQPVGTHFSDKVAALIEAESAISSDEFTHSVGSGTITAERSGWMNPLAKMAIAASVALVFIVTFQSTNNLNTSANLQVLEESVPSNSATNVTPILASETTFEVDPIAEQRLRDYIQTMGIDEDEPVLIEHIQESPLYRLVNQIQEQPQKLQ